MNTDHQKVKLFCVLVNVFFRNHEQKPFLKAHMEVYKECCLYTVKTSLRPEPP